MNATTDPVADAERRLIETRQAAATAAREYAMAIQQAEWDLSEARAALDAKAEGGT